MIGVAGFLPATMDLQTEVLQHENLSWFFSKNKISFTSFLSWRNLFNTLCRAFIHHRISMIGKIQGIHYQKERKRRREGVHGVLIQGNSLIDFFFAFSVERNEDHKNWVVLESIIHHSAFIL
jgi:hypothetical protein